MIKILAIQPESVVHRVTDVEFSKLGDELLAIDEKAEYCYALNKSAGRIWELIAAPVPVSSLCARLREEFMVDTETCFLDVVQLLRALNDAGLVEVNDGPAD